MTPAISIENLSKCYRIGQEMQAAGGKYRTLRESLTDAASASLRKLRGKSNRKHTQDFWALKDVSFDVQPGEVVGIIGGNGAGKSTLLKILSRITRPTSGEIKLRGRVASLLEVGTGFHPELTGRENIYLNGSILGMSRREIDRKFDEIVAFAGIEAFLETPVKRYSSGMYVRLGFAVASHLDLEILVIDEVLAVGDIAFQKKCLGKMKDVTQSGRTVLFVSHNMAAVYALCNRGILIEHGRIRHVGEIHEVGELYLSSQMGAADEVDAGRLPCSSPAKDLILMSVSVRKNDPDLVLRVTLKPTRRFPIMGIGFAIRADDGTLLVSQGPLINGVQLHDLASQTEVAITLRDALKVLNGGCYSLDLWVGYPGVEILIKQENLIRFEVPERDPYGNGHALSKRTHGPCCLIADFTELKT